MNRKIKVLHVVGIMDRGGVETWLMHVLRNIDRKNIAMDFLVHTTKPGVFDNEIRSLGAKVIPCPGTKQIIQYAKSFNNIVEEFGPYDVIHSHVHHYSGLVLYLAAKAGIPKRIAHGHNDRRMVTNDESILRRIYYGISKYMIRRYATIGLACSRQAAEDLFTEKWENDNRWRLLFYGIDLNVFKQFIPQDRNVRNEARLEFGFPVDAFVLGHVGSFSNQKNHKFLLSILADVIQRAPDIRVLLIGDGNLRTEIERRAYELGLSNHVVFAGIRSDVPRLMSSAMDAYIFPSLYEGLGLVLVEAQAAGLPCVFSDVVPIEADIVDSLIHRISLTKPSSSWAESIIDIYHKTQETDQVNSLKAVCESDYDIHKSVKSLVYLYSDSVKKNFL